MGGRQFLEALRPAPTPALRLHPSPRRCPERLHAAQTAGVPAATDSRSRLLSSSSSSPPAAPFPCAVAAGREPPSLAPPSLFFLTATGRRPPRRHRHLPASLVPRQNCSVLPNESHITDANQGLMPPCKSLWNLGWTLAAAVICCVLFPRTSQLARPPR